VRFGVLARPIRTNPTTLKCWAEILARVPNSELHFDHVPYTDVSIQERLTKELKAQGVSEERIAFKNTRPHWKALQNIDILLDPFPSGSATITTESLFMERLVVTLDSRPPMGRISAAQIHALGLSDYCVATSIDEYIKKAVVLASNRTLLNSLSEGLRERFFKSPLADYEGYSQKITSLYKKLWRDWCQSIGNVSSKS
jgi:predicted O-linked N-acetylglucosamine transferase (SPINDLY family)